MGSLLRAFISRSVMRKGVRGGSPFWLVIGALSLIRRFYQRNAKRTEAVALSERLRPGDELVLRYPGRPGRQTRKEIRIDRKRREAVQAKHGRRIAKLESRVARGGFSGSRARKALDALLRDVPR